METRRKSTVALLFGGKSSEHEVSLTSAASVIQKIDPEKFSILPILITKEGRWMLVEDTSFLTAPRTALVREQECPTDRLAPVFLDYAHSRCLVEIPGRAGRSWMPDVALPILHGPGGEDGSVQGLFQLAGIPCAGAGILGSSLGLDKVMCKNVLEHYGIEMAPYLAFLRKDWLARSGALCEDMARALGFPMFVKPANCGSSMGISKVRSVEELRKGVETALGFDRKVIVERGIDAREIECAVLGNDEPEASALGEILPSNEFYDYQAKYFQGSRLVIPAEIPSRQSDAIRASAVKIFCALECAGMGRVDFLLDRNSGICYFNEINTIPGFTAQSMYPKLWEATGLSYGGLIERLLNLAVERASALPR